MLPDAPSVEATSAALGKVTVGAICSEGFGTGESESDFAKYVIGFKLDHENDFCPPVLHPEINTAARDTAIDRDTSFRMV